ncbi:substrate-binding domain-containing protein [Aeromicrobium fastidiosum]|uniref:Substrate-binding domain-containing protein n=1 Tax=Aeromicrobium fastidiosum TaxID=52699 RepID=A0A641AM50_9ACTN|nr:substrate-binding domain-containing protein [Aeromicrobium fastidiosum]KAA1374801.1 substrate-binding domain-containing protein [Aeromicrobium fastidiosum]MBP2390648.1 simple sugar transport system substrate-binding protein [Aeromicrobium fastidiosum]
MKMRSRPLAIAAIVASSTLTLAACSSGTSAESTPAKSTGGASALGKGVKVVVVGGPLSDPFFSAVDKGGSAAAAAMGASYDYTAPKDFSNAVADLTQLTQAAITKKADVLVIGDFIPAAQDAEIKKAVDAGITVVVFNSGIDSWQKIGAVGFAGENPEATGKAAGAALSSGGAKNLVCVNHIPENPVLQVRCDGAIAAVKAAGGTGETLTIPSAESSDIQGDTQKIKGYLKSNPDVDGVFTLGTNVAVAAEAAVEQSGKDVTIGTTDLSTQVLDDVKSGKLAFTIDQQPFLQLYQAVTAGVMDRVLGLRTLDDIETSPLMITRDNVDQVIDVQKKFGVRGAS